jgi:hypothetical protein
LTELPYESRPFIDGNAVPIERVVVAHPLVVTFAVDGDRASAASSSTLLSLGIHKLNIAFFAA